MANTDAAFGFRPNVNLAGGTPARNGGYTIDAALASAIYSGDLVRSTGTGREITPVIADATVNVLGVFAGCQYVNDSGDIIWSPYWPGVALADVNKVVECWVYDDPNLELIAQATQLAEAEVGDIFDILAGAGDPATGRSGFEVNQADTVNPKVRVTGLAPGIDGIVLAEYGAFAKVRCTILTHERAPGALATAI